MNDEIFEDLIVSDDDKKEISELISSGKNPGFIGFNGGINPDIFDQDQKYSNVENVINELKSYDFLVLKTNKKRLVPLPIPYFTCFKKDLIFVSRLKEDLFEKIDEVFDNLNLKTQALSEIITLYPVEKSIIEALEAKYDCAVSEKVGKFGELIVYDDTFELLKRPEKRNLLKLSSKLDLSFDSVVVPKENISNYKNEPEFSTKFFTFKDVDHLKKLLALGNVLVLLTDKDLTLLKDILKEGLEVELDLEFLNQSLLTYNIVTTKPRNFSSYNDLAEMDPNRPLALINGDVIFTTVSLLDNFDYKNKKILVGEEGSEIIGEYLFL